MARRRFDWRVVPLLVAAGALFVIVAARHLQRSSRDTVPAIGVPFPRLALAPLPGTPLLTDGSLRIGRPMLVNLFASWCVPCRAEATQLAALRAQGIAVAGIAVRDAPGDTAAFLAATGTRYDVLGLDPRGKIQPVLGSDGIPETWLVDGAGIVRARFRGDLHVADLPRIETAVAAAR